MGSQSDGSESRRGGKCNNTDHLTDGRLLRLFFVLIDPRKGRLGELFGMESGWKEGNGKRKERWEKEEGGLKAVFPQVLS